MIHTHPHLFPYMSSLSSTYPCKVDCAVKVSTLESMFIQYYSIKHHCID